MNLEEKQTFIHEFLKSMELFFQETTLNMPENWDGIELRQFIADKFQQQTHKPFQDGRKARRKDYENTVIINNL